MIRDLPLYWKLEKKLSENIGIGYLLKENKKLEQNNILFLGPALLMTLGETIKIKLPP